jgi:succinoglycan biosynthesis transport protein ExoP
VSVNSSDTSGLVAVHVRDSRAVRAGAIVNALVRAYVRFRQTSAALQLRQAAALAGAELAALGAQQQNSPLASELRQRQQALRIAAGVETGGAQVIALARTPSAPTRSSPAAIGLVGGGVGGLLGLTCALILELADGRLKDEVEIARVLDVPVLALVPRVRPPRPRRGRTGGGGDRAAYELLAANLGFGADGTGPRSVLVTSPGAGDGRSTVTLDLARALRSLGRTVVVIEAHPGPSGIASRLGMAVRPALTAVLAGRSTDADEVVRLNGPAGAAIGSTDASSQAPIGVVAGGTIAQPQPRPQTLAERAFATRLEQAHEVSDVVLVDATPSDAGGMAQAWARLVDSTLIVLRCDHTPSRSSKACLELLRSVRGPGALGAVVLGVR